MLRLLFFLCAFHILHITPAEAASWPTRLQASFLGAAAKVAGSPPFLKKLEDSPSAAMHVHKTRKSDMHKLGERVWHHEEEVYCSENWNISNAKAARNNSVPAKKCLAQCEADENCLGVSVTNNNFGDQAPWCHMCTSYERTEHANLDTFWKEDVTALEEREQKLYMQLLKISDIEVTLCSDPEAVSLEEFQMVRKKTATRKLHKDAMEKVLVENEERLKELKEDTAEAEAAQRAVEAELVKIQNGDHDGTKEEVENREAELHKSTDILAKAIEENDDKIHIIQVEKPKIYIELESERLDTESKNLGKSMYKLKKRQENVEEERQQVEDNIKAVKEEEDAIFWERWLSR